MEELRAKERKWEDRINDLEKEIKGWKDRINTKMEQFGNCTEENGARMKEDTRSKSNDRERRSEISRNRYTFSRRGSSYEGSRISEDRFSEKEARFVKKCVTNKGRGGRKCNNYKKETFMERRSERERVDRKLSKGKI